MTDVTLKVSFDLYRTYHECDEVTLDSTFTLSDLVQRMEDASCEDLSEFEDHMQAVRSATMSAKADDYEYAPKSSSITSGDLGLTYDTTIDDLKELLDNG